MTSVHPSIQELHPNSIADWRDFMPLANFLNLERLDVLPVLPVLKTEDSLNWRFTPETGLLPYHTFLQLSNYL